LHAAQGASNLTTQLETIRAQNELPALGAALVTLEGPAEVWVTGKRRAGGPENVTSEDLWHIGSCTKAMTATLIELLVARGDLSWEKELGELLPDLVTDMHVDFLDLTLVELVSHRAGLAANLDGDFSSIESKDPLQQREFLTRLALTQAPHHAPRGAFLYSNGGFVIAGHVAEVVTKTSWEELMQRLLFEPLGMQSAGFGPPGTRETCDQPRGHTPDGKPVEPGSEADNPPALGPAGTVHASLADWAKFIQLHLRGSREAVKVGEIELTPAAFERLHTPYPEAPGQKYGYGWVFEKRPWAGGDGLALWHNGSNTLWYCVTWLGPGNGFAGLATTNVFTPKAQKAADEAIQLILKEFEKRQAPR
jgi:CubicO group peptidase (beta-lactamase class C family)